MKNSKNRLDAGACKHRKKQMHGARWSDKITELWMNLYQTML